MSTKSYNPVLSTKSYESVELAAKAGFNKVIATHQQEFKEFDFWIVQIVQYEPSTSSFLYFFTDPKEGGSGAVRSVMPMGYTVCAYCHTHPRLTNSGDFSTGDKRLFVKLRQAQPIISFYLLNPYRQIRRANYENEFPAGVSVPW